jgi:tripartite-type tricarboxylate transporter receptor subunit TctC
MKIPRRRFLRLAMAAAPAGLAGVAGAALAVPFARLAWALDYPVRPVRLVVGFAAAGGNDIVARLIGQWLSERLGQQFIIENRPGAGTNIATEAVVRAQPDGYTLLLVAPTAAINATLYDKLNFVYLRDIAPVAGIMRVADVLLVHPSLPVNTLDELINYARSNPGRINIASAGAGSGPHMAGELLKMMTGVNMIHVPYRGTAPALTDLLSGQVQAMFASAPGSIEYIRAGKLRALAVTDATRSQALPDVPTVGESVPGFEAAIWYGVGAPRNTPAEIVGTLNKEINAGLGDAKLKTRLAGLGGTVIPGSPADFGRFVAAETEKWAKVVRFSGARPD